MRQKLSLLFLLTFFIAFAQERDFKFGRLSAQEIKLTEVPFEKNADAVILSEEGKMDLTNNQYYLTVKRRIKILTEKGIEEANIQLSYYSDKKRENIIAIKGNTINVVNGETVVTPIDEKEIFDVKINELYSGKRFTFPNVKVGSIIEYTYQKSSDFNFSIDAWNFQHPLPTLYSEFRMKNSSYGSYSIITIGDELNLKYKGKPNAINWSLSNLKSNKQLKYVYNQEDQSERIKFQAAAYHTEGTSKSTLIAWRDLINDVNSDYETYRNPSAMKEIANTIPNGKDEMETLRNVVAFMDENVKWNNFYSIIPNRSNRNLLKNKVGTSADMNLMLNEILTAKGIQSSLVLYSTRSHGQVLFSYPFVNQFNSVLTSVSLKNGQIEFGPINAFNYHGVVIARGDVRFVKLTQKISTYEEILSYQFTKGQVILNRKDRFNGYFYNENTKDENVLKRYVTESLEMQLDAESDEKLDFQNGFYSKIYRAKNQELNAPFYTFINPLREFLKQYTFEDQHRQRKIEFQFPYLFNIQVQAKIPENYEVILDNKFR